MRVLLSIKPEYADKIFDRTKRYEYRRKIFARSDIKTVIVYATKPVGRIVGEFDIERVIRGSPVEIWNKTYEFSGISREYFEEYFRNCNDAFALKVKCVRPYTEPVAPKEICPKFTPPQSYMYVEGDQGIEWLDSRQAEMF